MLTCALAACPRDRPPLGHRARPHPSWAWFRPPSAACGSTVLHNPFRGAFRPKRPPACPTSRPASPVGAPRRPQSGLPSAICSWLARRIPAGVKSGPLRSVVALPQSTPRPRTDSERRLHSRLNINSQGLKSPTFNSWSLRLELAYRPRTAHRNGGACLEAGDQHHELGRGARAACARGHEQPRRACLLDGLAVLHRRGQCHGLLKHRRQARGASAEVVDGAGRRGCER